MKVNARQGTLSPPEEAGLKLQWRVMATAQGFEALIRGLGQEAEALTRVAEQSAQQHGQLTETTGRLIIGISARQENEGPVLGPRAPRKSGSGRSP